MNNSIIVLTVPGDYLGTINYEVLVLKKILKNLNINFLDASSCFYNGISFYENTKIKIRDKILNSLFNKKILFDKGKIFLKEKKIQKNSKKCIGKFAKLLNSVVRTVERYRRVLFLINTYEELFVSLILINILKTKNEKQVFFATGAFFRNVCLKKAEYDFVLNSLDYINVNLDFEYFLKEIKIYKTNSDVRGLVSKKNYLKFESIKNNNNIFKNNSLIGLGKKFFYKDFSPMIISYNCYYKKCNFCYEKFINAKPLVKNVFFLIDEIEYLYKKCDIKKIFFNDNFIHINYLIIFSREIIKRNIFIEWTAKTKFNVKMKSNENCELLRRAGCKKLFMGVESYSAKMLNIYNKNIEITSVVPILKILKSKDINTHISLLFGFPGETKDDRKKTFEFIKKNLNIIDIVEVNLYMHNSHTFESKKIFNKKLIKYVEKVRAFIRKQGKTPRSLGNENEERNVYI